MTAPSIPDVEKVPVVDLAVWTPSGEERYTGCVHSRKAGRDGHVLTCYSQPGAIQYANQHGVLVPSSGLWYQTRAKLETDMPEVEKDFITGPLEDTATLWKYLKIGEKHADGLLIQYPIANAEGTDFGRDEKGIPRARQIWQMALPLSNKYFVQMPPELDAFVNTLFGMPDAMQHLPDYAYFYLGSTPEPGEERRAFRSYWSRYPESRRVDVDGDWDPAGRHSDVGFRMFEGGKETIREADARTRRLIVQTSDMKEAERYAALLRQGEIPFTEE